MSPCRLVGTSLALVLAAGGLQLLTLPQAQANPTGTGLVINEAYVNGGSSGAAWKYKFVELYNPTGSSISLSGDSLQYRSPTGTGNANGTYAFSDSAAVAAGGHFLVQLPGNGAASNPGSDLPSADVTTTALNPGSGGGTLYLLSTATATTPTDSSVIDKIGWGTSNSPEGTAATGNSIVLSYQRTNGLDTDNNAADFTAGAPTPENAAGQTTPPAATGVTVTSPGNETYTQGTAITPVTLSAAGGTAPYSWAVTAGALPAGLSLSSGGTLAGTPSVTGSFPVTVTATDSSAQTGSASFIITVQAPPQQVAIAAIQTADPATSPLTGQTVTTTGVVTADYATGGFNGFYLQTGGTGGGSDATPGESDAIFVYGSASAGQVRVGDSVSVTGTVALYHGALEIDSPTVTELADPLPTVTPAALAWSDLTTTAQKEAHEGELLAPQGDFTVTDNYNANFYGEIELASGDQMLRQPTDVGTAGSPAAEEAAAYNTAHAIFLDDGSSTTYSPTGSAKTQPLPWLTATTPVSDGATVTFHQPLVLDYRNSQWNLQPTAPVVGDGSAVATFSDMRTQHAAPAPVGGDVRLATFNMENFFPTTGEQYVASTPGTSCSWYDDNAGEHIAVNECGVGANGGDGSGPRGAATDDSFQRQLQKEVTSINGLGASVVSLEELENGAKFVSAIPTTGLPDGYDGDPRDYAPAVIVDALNAVDGAGTWAYVPSPAAADLPPLEEQDVIRTAFIYRPAAITPVGVSHVLTDDSDAGQPFAIAREPMAQAFTAAGTPDSDAFLVVANHMKSKGADATGLYSDCLPGGAIDATGADPSDTDDSEPTDPAVDQGGFNCTRVHEVHDMWTWAQAQARAVHTDKIFLVGDFNAYDHEDPIEYLLGQGLTDVGAVNDPTHSSYSYDGLEGSLDHVMATPAAYAMVAGASIWQINAQESVAYAYSRYHYSGTTPDLFDASTPWATSDHDPEVVGLDLPSTPPAKVTPTVTGSATVITYGQAGTVYVQVRGSVGTPSGTVSLSSGSTSLGTHPLTGGAASFTIGKARLAVGAHRLTISYTGDASYTSATGSVSVTVMKATATVVGLVSGKVRVHRTAARLRVKVAAIGVTPTGVVKVAVNGHTLRTRLSGGSATVRLPRFTSAGTKPIRVAYLGDSHVGSRSVTVTVRVVR